MVTSLHPTSTITKTKIAFIAFGLFELISLLKSVFKNL